MMLVELGEVSAAANVEGAIEKVICHEEVTTVSALSGIPTDEWGDRVVEQMRLL